MEAALALRPNATRLLALRARVDRLRTKRDQEPLLPAEALHRLRHLRPELRPVTLLPAGLGYLALTDGEPRRQRASGTEQPGGAWAGPPPKPRKNPCVASLAADSILKKN